MAIKDLTSMCRTGRCQEAYDLAKADMAQQSDNIWAQRGVGWVLYYMIKEDIEQRAHDKLLLHLDELMELPLLSATDDAMIFDNILRKLTEYIKPLEPNQLHQLSALFSSIRAKEFAPSEAYSYFLKSVLKFDKWSELADFITWWNMDKLRSDDYEPVVLDNGKRKIMSLAEQLYIAYSKQLLLSKDKALISLFLPKLNQLMENHPEMQYPGYFYGKLMLVLGANRDDALQKIMPFVRKKKNEFWVWQLLSEFYHDDGEMQLACLLRAVHCSRSEEFLGRLRMKLAEIYLRSNDKPRAKYHIERVASLYAAKGWNIPYEMQCLLREPWMHQVSSDATDGLGYIQPTDNLLLAGSNISLAIVAFVDREHKRVLLIHGFKQKIMTRLSAMPFKVTEGMLLSIYWLPSNESITILKITKANESLPADCPYIKELKGKVPERIVNGFVFLKSQSISCFISPQYVKRHHLKGGETVSVKAALTYNKKKDNWGWSCVSLTLL